MGKHGKTILRMAICLQCRQGWRHRADQVLCRRVGSVRRALQRHQAWLLSHQSRRRTQGRRAGRPRRAGIRRRPQNPHTARTHGRAARDRRPRGLPRVRRVVVRQRRANPD